MCLLVDESLGYTPGKRPAEKDQTPVGRVGERYEFFQVSCDVFPFHGIRKNSEVDGVHHRVDYERLQTFTIIRIPTVKMGVSLPNLGSKTTTTIS